MKTKFVINTNLFNSCNSIEEINEEFNEYFRPDGWQFDNIDNSIFIIIDKKIDLNESDRVDLYGIRIVKWKCYNVFEDIIEYIIEEE